MRHLFTRPALATCTIVLLASGCSDITQPPAARSAPDPSFSNGPPSETICSGVVTGTHQNVTAPPGAECLVVVAQILGNVKALEGSRVRIGSSTVHGNVEGDRPFSLAIADARTLGNVFVTGAGTVPSPAGGLAFVGIGENFFVEGDVHVLKSSVDRLVIFQVTSRKGSIKVEDNVVSGSLLISTNQVAQNLQVFKNQGGEQSVTGNTVGANLQCFENVAVFFLGGPNVAQKAEGQCF